MKRWKVWSVALVGALMVLLGASPAHAEPPLGAVFNGSSDLWAISKRVASMIDAAPAGSAIRVAEYRLSGDDPNVIPALRRAVARGVKVKIVLDLSDRNPNPLGDPGLATLKSDIAQKMGGVWDNPDKDSFIVACSWGCVGDRYNHNKFFLFSTMGTKKKVVMQSTANVSRENAVDAWNAAYAVAGLTDLYQAYWDYFDDLSHQRQNLDYYTTTTDGTHKVYIFPRASKTGDQDDPTSDTIIGILNNVSCTGNTTVGTSTNHRTIIRIAMWGFTREEIARKLRALANADCWVDVAINRSDDVSNEVRDLLKGHPRINVDDVFTSGRFMHAKYLLVEGNYDGTANSKTVFMGSHNFTLNALRHNDEAWLKIQSATVHDQFRANFREIMAASDDFAF